MLTSVVFIATPTMVLAGGGISHPHGTTINVKAGDNFNLLYKLYWNDVGTDGMFGVTLVWYNYNNAADDNLTFVSAEAYWEDNLDAITCDTPTLTATPSGADTMYTLEFKNTSFPNSSDENFFVKIKMGAYGEGGIWHKADDNHPIEAPAGLKAVTVFELAIVDIDGTQTPITVDVSGAGNTVSIAPASKSGWTGENLSYTVTVNNLGEVADTYTMTVSDDILPSWTKGIFPSSLNVGALSSANATLWVIVGTGGTDNLTVKAAGSRSENTGTCQAIQKTGPQVDVTVTPAWQENLPGGNLYYTATVKNIGTITDNYDVTVTEVVALGWTLPAGYNTGNLAPNASDIRTLIVGIPGAAVPSTTNNIRVKAVSENDITVQDNVIVQGHVKAALGVDVTISPTYQDGCTGEYLCYSANIKNTGVATDNYTLTVTDTKGWNASFCAVENSVAWDNLDVTVDIMDSHVNENQPNTVADSGKRYNMYVGWDLTYLSQRIYMKYDLSTIPNNAKICRAVMWLKTRYGCSYGITYIPTSYYVNAMTVDSDAWIESTLTWNNAPPMGTKLDDENFVGVPTGGKENQWYQWDVTSWVVSQYAGDKIASIGLKRADEGTYEGSGWFYSRDVYPSQGAFRPHLEVTYVPIPATPITTKTIRLRENENVNVCLYVRIPCVGSPISETDTITVTAVSQTDPLVKDNASAIAHNVGSVKVEITPRSQEAQCVTVKELIDPCYRYDPVTFKVAVTNCGCLDDKYELEVSDTLGWGLKLTPQELYVPAGDTEYAALSVTVPDDVEYCTTDTITVKAIGKLASNEQEVIGYWDIDIVTVHATICKGVEIELLPDDVEPQTGTPCSTLTWLVVVKNVGNKGDNFCLDVDQLVYDCAQEGTPRIYPDWNAWFEGQEPVWTDNCFWLDPCSKAVGFLRVKIPDDARTSIWDNITVTVWNETQYGMPENKYVKLSDSYMVRAHVLEPGPRIPEGVIEIAVEAEVVAIDIWPISKDFGVMDEYKEDWTGDTYFTIRNVGNVKENILVRGTDAQSMPGEPVTSWELNDSTVGIDQYMLACYGAQVAGILTPNGPTLWLDDGPMPIPWPKPLFTTSLCPGCERQFGVWIRTPSVITTPARMWARIKITAIAAMTYGRER